MVPWSRLRHGDDGGSREFSHILEGEIARSCLWIKLFIRWGSWLPSFGDSEAVLALSQATNSQRTKI